MASRRGEKEESPMKGVPPRMGGPSAVGDKSLHGLSQIGGGNHMQSVFNEGDVSMLEEVNKLLAGLGPVTQKRGSINSWRNSNTAGNAHRGSVDVEVAASSTRGNEAGLPPVGPRSLASGMNEFAPI
jgi:hypothetical protein